MKKITVSDVTESFMTMRRIEYKRLCFETRLLLGEKERIDGRNKIYLVRRRRALCLRVERC